MTDFRIRPLDAAVDTKGVRCGQQALDEYIKRYASQDVRRDLARVFVVVPGDNVHHLAGYFTLSAGSVTCSDFPKTLARKLPHYPVPVALIGRLAVDKEFSRTGPRFDLACRRLLKSGAGQRYTCGRCDVVDAKDDSARNFYQHFGFLPFPGQPNRLLLPATAFKR